MVKETAFQNKVIKHFESIAGFVFNIHGSEWQRQGMPDLLIHHRKWNGYLELKVGTNMCSDVQKHIIREIKARHFPAFVLYPEYICNEESEILVEGWTWDNLLDILIGL